MFIHWHHHKNFSFSSFYFWTAIHDNKMHISVWVSSLQSKHRPTRWLNVSKIIRFKFTFCKIQFSSVQLLSCVQLFATPWIATRQATLSITNSLSSPKLMSIEWVMPSSHLILCRPLLLLPPTTPSIRVFSNESTLRMISALKI